MSIINKVIDKTSDFEGEHKRKFINDLNKYLDDYDYSPRTESIEGVPVLPEKFAKLILPDLSDNCKIFSDLLKFNVAASPRSHHSYHFGAVISLLSTIAAGRLKILKGQKGSKTDFYFLHHGHSSVWAKSQALIPVKQVLEELELEFLILPSDMTVSYAYSEMSPKTKLDMPDDLDYPEEYKQQLKKNKFAGQRCFILDELGKVLRGMTNEKGISYEWGRLFLEFADNNKYMSKATMKDDTRTIVSPTLTLVGNSTPPNFVNIADEKIASMKGDGLFPRFLVACPTHTDTPVYAMSEKPIPVPDNVIANLFHWHNALGEPEKDVFGRQEPVVMTTLELDADATIIHNEYDKWLFECRLKEFPDWKPAYTRHANKVLKIAALMASVNGKTIITKFEYAYALQIGEMYRHCLHIFYDSIDNPEMTNKFKEREDAILAKLDLWNSKGKLPVNHSTLAAKLPKKLFQNLSKTEVYGILDNLQMAGLIIYPTPKSISLPQDGAK
jgi:hypothetical protein